MSTDRFPRDKIVIRKFIMVENIRLVCLLDLTADFGVKKKTAKLAPIFMLREKLVFKAIFNPD